MQQPEATLTSSATSSTQQQASPQAAAVEPLAGAGAVVAPAAPQALLLTCNLHEKPWNRQTPTSCQKCKSEIRRGRRTKCCTRCLALFCPACARSPLPCSAPPCARRMCPIGRDRPAVEPCGQPQAQELAARACAAPAIPILAWTPRTSKNRIADLFIQLLSTAAESLDGCRPEDREWNLRLLWLAPTLLLRRLRPADTGDRAKSRPRNGREGGDATLIAELRRRAALAEAGQRCVLLNEYLQERDHAEEEDARRAGGGDDRGDVRSRLDTLEAAARKVQGGCLSAGAQLLRGDARVLGTRETQSKLRDLTAIEITP